MMQLDADGFANPMLIRFGYALLHFLWQGILIAGMTSTGLRLLRQASSSQRYLYLLTMFGVLTLLPPVTFLLVDKRPPGLAMRPSGFRVPIKSFKLSPLKSLKAMWREVRPAFLPTHYRLLTALKQRRVPAANVSRIAPDSGTRWHSQKTCVQGLPSR